MKITEFVSSRPTLKEGKEGKEIKKKNLGTSLRKKEQSKQKYG